MPDMHGYLLVICVNLWLYTIYRYIVETYIRIPVVLVCKQSIVSISMIGVNAISISHFYAIPHFWLIHSRFWWSKARRSYELHPYIRTQDKIFGPFLLSWRRGYPYAYHAKKTTYPPVINCGNGKSTIEFDDFREQHTHNIYISI